MRTRAIFLSEKSEGLYSTEQYYFAITLVETLVSCMIGILYCSLFYLSTSFDLDGLERSLYASMLFCCVSSQIPQLSALTFVNPLTASLAAISVYVLASTLSGFFPLKVEVEWLKYSSPLTYFYDALVISKFPSDAILCNITQIEMLSTLSPINMETLRPFSDSPDSPGDFALAHSALPSCI